MITLSSVLERFAEVEKLPQAEMAGKPLDVILLREALVRCKRSNMWVFAIVLAMVIGLFVIEIVLIGQNLNNETTVKAIHGAFGVTAAALIGTMIWLWKEHSRINLFYEIAAFMDAATLKTMINQLFRNQMTGNNPRLKL